LLVLSVDGVDTLAPLEPRTARAVYQALMLVVCVAVLVVSLQRRWSESWKLAAVMLAVFLLTRYVDWFWDLLPAYVFFLILAALAFIWLLALRRIRARLVAVGQ
jgi:uncharacterized membrane protein